MNRKANGHNADYLKRQANKIKKQLGMPHNEAIYQLPLMQVTYKDLLQR